MIDVMPFAIDMYLGDTKKTEICKVTVNGDRYDAFNYAIANHYWYQMFIDDLPIWGSIF
jgi:transmembrane 9 superfamily member 3